MRLLLTTLLILTLAVAFTLAAVEDPGYVLITRTPWSVEMSLSLFAMLLVLGFVLVYLVARLLAHTFNMPATIAAWRRQRHAKKAQQSQARGLIHLVEGEWAKAEKSLLAYLSEVEVPVVNYLAAAFAAQQLGDPEKRDQYLSLAHQCAPKQALAIGLIQAELQYQAHQAERSLAALTRLQSLAPKNQRMLKLLVKLYRELRDWRAVAALLPTLRKAEVFDAEQIDNLEFEAQRELLSVPVPQGSAHLLNRIWDAVPKTQRQNPVLIGVYARRLLELNEMDECESLLRGALKRQWDHDLVLLYGLVRSADAEGQFKVAEGWLKSNPYSANLLLTLGRLAAANELWDKARTYLTESLSTRPSPEAAYALGRLLEQLDEGDAARAAYRRGLELSGDGTAAAETARAASARQRAVS